MRSTAFSKTQEEKEFEFPCLLQHKDSNIVILALNSAENGRRINGVVVFPGVAKNALGYETDYWNSDRFKMYSGEVRLSNE